VHTIAVPRNDTASTRTVVHVVPSDLRRGAQIVAAELRARLHSGHEHHVLVTLFDAPASRLDRVHALGARSGRLRRLGFDPRPAIALRRALRTLQPRVVIAHGGESLKYVAFAARRTPIIYYRIGVSTAAGRRGARLALQRRSVRRADLVVAISEDVRKEMVDLLRAPSNRVVVIPNGRDPAVFHPGTHAAADGPARLLFVGHLVESKRPGLFLDVVAELTRRQLDVRGVVVGDGPLLDEIRAAAPQHVDVLGPRDDVPDLLRAADMFTFTSVVEGEGFPGVLVEAAMTGLPIVTTRVPGASDVVRDGVSGAMVDPNDRAALFDAAERIVRDRDRWRAMGEASRQHAVEHFDLDAVVARWREALARVAVPTTQDAPT
jgi:glycosyltransferase involved in cell wall biosynthesis